MSGNDQSKDFDAFVSAGEVETGAPSPAAAAAKPARRGPSKPAEAKEPVAAAVADDDQDEGGNQADDDDLGHQEGDDGDQGGNSGGDADDDDDLGNDDDDRRETAEGRVKRIKRERAEAKRERDAEKARADALEARLALLEKGGLPANQNASSNVDKLGPAPDPTDMAKYPLGHLDAQYIEDRTDWAADKRIAQNADADLQRQQEEQRNQTTQAEQQQLATTFKNVMDKGTAIYDDFEEVTMKTKWSLGKATFDAAAEVPNGARILYNLAKNTAEADRVAALSPYQQSLYVAKRNDEIAEKLKVRKKPGAGAPPTQNTRGGNSRVSINPGTDNLDEFAKLWNKK